jgi:iron(III) transport system substrate-binding protein
VAEPSSVAAALRSADVVMTSDALGMLDFVKRGNVENYTDPNVKNLPKYAQFAPGVVAMSEDPVAAVFNKAPLPEAKQPKDMASLAALSGSIKGKVATTDMSNPCSSPPCRHTSARTATPAGRPSRSFWRRFPYTTSCDGRGRRG